MSFLPKIPLLLPAEAKPPGLKATFRPKALIVSQTMNVELYLLNYNGADFILEGIKSLLEAVKKSKYKSKLFVIDNVSQDNSVALIEKQFPEVTVLKMKENRVLCSFNDVAEKSDADIIFLLNSDVKVEPDFIDPIVNVFERSPDAFLVSARSFLFDGSYEGGLSKPKMRLGNFETTCRFHGFEQEKEKPQYTFAAGFGGFDRKKFISLGGYDDLYLPGRMEDADIGLRAWKSGWKSYYEPRSILYHMGSKSFNTRFGRRGTMEIAHKNMFLFIWKNIRDIRFLCSHFLFLPFRMIWMLLKGQYEYATAFGKALKQLPGALKRRSHEANIKYRYNERQVISFFYHGS